MPPGEAARAVEATLGKPLDAVFASFDPEPRAAASIAQVHDAVLLDGTEVVVKVQRPGLRRRFGADFRVMAVLAAATTSLSKSARMSNAGEILPLAAEINLIELDFRLEALNMIHVAAAGEARARVSSGCRGRSQGWSPPTCWSWSASTASPTPRAREVRRRDRRRQAAAARGRRRP